MSDPVLPNRHPTRESTLGEYRWTLESLKSMSDEELRRLAADMGIDGVDTMGRSQLIAKLIDEPGANEI